MIIRSRKRRVAIISHLNVLVWCVMSCMVTGNAMAMGDGCVPDDVPDVAIPRLFNAVPYQIATKGWSVSDSMNQHFTNQKKLLASLADISTVSTPMHNVSLASVGDIMRMPTEQPFFVDEKVNRHLGAIDIVLGNLETLISPSYELPPESLFMMNSDPTLLSAFRREDGSNIFSALSLANNHIYDYPDDAIDDTVDLLEKLGIQHNGVVIEGASTPYTVVEVEGVSVGYYAVTTFVNDVGALEKSARPINPILEGLAMVPYLQWQEPCSLDYSPIKNALAQMDKNGIDFKIISIHWGVEHDMYPQPKQMQIARELMRLGADVVVGAHTHVPQPAEVCFFNGYEKLFPQLTVSGNEYQCLMNTPDGKPRKSMVYYSLGNFTSYTPFFWQQLGTIAELSLDKSESGDVDWHSPQYTYTYDYTFNPPHGAQKLTLLDESGEYCPWDFCVNDVSELAGYPRRHMEGPGLGLFDQWKISGLTAINSIGAMIKWKSFRDTPK